MKIKATHATTWQRAVNFARRTVGKKPIDHDPSDKWKAQMLLAEHSPIRTKEYDIFIEDIPMWVTTHLVRHKIGAEHFIHTQREDRRELDCKRGDLPQGALNDGSFALNAQALINISRKRLCRKASPETRQVWEGVKDAVREIDEVMADKMVPNCIYQGRCHETECCGYIATKEHYKTTEKYLKTDYDNEK